MALAGLIWFAYVIFHMLSLLVFHQGAESFNDFYQQLNQLSLYYLLLVVLIALLAFHVYTAIVRQLANRKSKGAGYKKPYPHEISRVVAWIGASTLFAFIVIHFVQMKVLIDKQWYEAIIAASSAPFMLAFYVVGLLTLSVHLHHGLSNVLQTLGVTHKPYHYLVIIIVLMIFVGFLSVLVGAIL